MSKSIVECSEIITSSNFFIKDGKEKEPAFIVDKDGEFEIINTNEKEILFIVTDNCMYDSEDETRCDCIISDDKTFCFIELKNCKRTAWKNHREKAEKQLENTINNFKSESAIKDKNLEAYMCCTCIIDDEYTKIKKASNKSEIITYFEETLNTSLYCDNKKEFK